MSYRARARLLRPYIEKAAASLNDKEALEAKELYPRWTADTAYKIGDRILYFDVLYKVLQDHTSHEAYPPDITVSLYAEVLIPDPEVIPDWVQPESTNPYMKGDKVRHNGHVWICDFDYNVYEPGVAGWTIVE